MVRKWIGPCLLVVAAVVGGWRATAAGADHSGSGQARSARAGFAQATSGPGDQPDPQRGAQLFGQDCAVCHGVGGTGSNLAPDITERGLAAIDFQLRTGRMPLASTESGRPAPDYTAEQIDDVLAYAATFVSGPEVPVVDLDGADLSNGQELYAQNCAACHQSVGSGGILAYDVKVPALTSATPVEVVEAMRTAPGKMPEFGPESFSDDEARDVAAYVRYLHDPDDRGGFDLGHYGPVPEGLVAVVFGLGAIVGVARLLGTRASEEADEEEGTGTGAG